MYKLCTNLTLFFAFLGAALLGSAHFNTLQAQEETTAVVQSAPSWILDIDQAKEKAKNENKPLYLLFTGTKWCIWCTRMDNDVYKKPEFWSTFNDKVVFAMVDVPVRRDDNVSRLMNMYKILGVPSIVVLNPNGQEIGRLGYPSARDTSLTPLQAHIDQLNTLLKKN